MKNASVEGLLNNTAETIGGSDDLVDGIAHFVKKNKTEEGRKKIDERSDNFKAAGKIVKGGLGWAALGIGLVVALKLLKE